MARQSRKVQPNGREMRAMTGAIRDAVGTRQASDTRNGEGEGEPKANQEQGNTVEMEGAEMEMEKDMTMSETTAEIEMGAATSNDQSNPTQLRQVIHVDHGSAGAGSGSDGRFGTSTGTAGGERENRIQSRGVRS